jgi:hypothetical protein
MSDRIRVEQVSFDSGGAVLAGDLYLPPVARAAVVVAGSWTTVKEQMAGRYAAGLAERGIAALAFDFRGYGASQGQPRCYESPERKAADLGAALGFLARRPEAADGRIGLLGVCAGAGYAAAHAAAGTRARSLALVAPWLHNAALVESVYGGAQGVLERIARGEQAITEYAMTGVVQYVPAVSTTDEQAAMYGPFDYYLDPARGAIPQWENRFAAMSWPAWLRFDPVASAPLISLPTLMVHSRDAALPEGAQRFLDGLAGPKRALWLSGGQFDFYDSEPLVRAAVDAAAEHFAATLPSSN